MLQILSPIIIILILNFILFKNNILFSNKLNLFDKPNLSRKLHKNPVPLNGGIFYFFNITFMFVYDYLLKKGIKKSRMSYEGMAHKYPLGGSEDKDRRVEILILSD